MPEEKDHIVKILAHILDDDDAIIMVLKEQLELHGIKYVVFNKDTDFINAFHEKVNMAIIDFKPSTAIAMDGVQITKNILVINPDTKVIMITGFSDDGRNRCETQREFFHSGGFRWWYKDEGLKKFGEYTLDAIAFIKAELQRKQLLNNTPGLVVRERKPLSVNNENDH